MSITATTHLNFQQGEARAALEFYNAVFGGVLTIATYGDFGAPADSPDAAAVVFGQVVTGDGFRVMAYDVPTHARRTPNPEPSEGSGPSTRREYGTTITTEPFFISLNGETLDEVTARWKGLVEGATVIEELAPTQWAPAFGMLTDRFGVTWVLGVTASY